jgi:sarcosine reductase
VDLEIGTFPVEVVALGTPAGWADGRLLIDSTRVRARVLADPRIRDVAVDLVEPGESTRVIHVRDVIEPRIKVEGRGHVYPGICDHPPDTVGSGRTFRYAGFGVLIASETLPHIRRMVSAATDSMIDMSGPGALTIYSTLRYLVLTLTTDPTLNVVEWNDALRGAGHRVSDDLAGLLRDQSPPVISRYALPPPPPSLPRMVHVHTLNASMVPRIGTGVYGFTPHALPMLLHPNEILDGAITGDAVVTYPGKCTWLHVNNPVLSSLYAHHGVDFAWAGSIIARARWESFQEKQLSAYQTVKLAQMLDAQGALVTWNHGGNGLIEVMLTIQGLEHAGIKTTLLSIESDITIVRLSPELAETGTEEPPLLFSVPEADAIVSTGPLAPVEALPPMARVVGGREIVFNQERPDVRTSAAGHLELESLSVAYSPIFGHFDHYGLGRQSYYDY